MSVRIKDLKLKSATVVETVIALLILMISFSAGMVIYTRVMTSGVNNEQLRAENELMFMMDSLSVSGHFEPVRLTRNNNIIEVTYSEDEQFPGLLLMTASCTDEQGVVSLTRLKWVSKHEK